MAALPEKIYAVEQVRELERIAIERGISESTLMQSAGTAAWEAVRDRWPQAHHVVVLAGGGNNAGDGYVVAQCAAQQQCEVTVVNAADPSRLKAAAADARRTYLEAGGREQSFEGDLPQADVIIDALLGIGLDRPLDGSMLEAVNCINRAACPVLSLDIPSGLQADTGAELGAAVRAAATVTFIGLKPGLLTAAGPRCCGELLFADLELAPEWYSDVAACARRLLPDDAWLPKRDRDAHKGAFGHVLIIGGDHGMGGAVRLAAEAALRTGAGLVSVATRAAHVPGMLAGLPEAMTRAVESPDELRSLLERATVIAVGPGLGQSDWGRTMLAQVLDVHKPLVLDADALNLLASAPRQRTDWVLTPHPGEAGRLLGEATGEIQADRFAALQELLDRYNGTVVLKGAGSLVGTVGELPAVCDCGNPGMAAPGMGDALTGMIAALAAQGLTLPQAARAGVYLHAVAGDRAALRGERGMLARDLIGELRSLVNSR